MIVDLMIIDFNELYTSIDMFMFMHEKEQDDALYYIRLIFFFNLECKKNTTAIWPICVALALFSIIVMTALVIVWINKRKER